MSLGVRVEPPYPVRACKQRCVSFVVELHAQGQTDKLLRVEFPNESRVWSSTYHSLVEANDQLECAEVARLWELWQRCPQYYLGQKTDTRISCDEFPRSLRSGAAEQGEGIGTGKTNECSTI